MTSASAYSSSQPPPPKRPRLNTDVSRFPSSSSLVSESARPQRRRRTLAPIVKQTIHEGTASLIPEEAVGEMLGQSCSLLAQSFGFDAVTTTALEEMRRLAEYFFETMIDECMAFARSQRRTRPTIQDFANFLERLGITAGDCESEIDRYRRATNTVTKPSHVFEIPEPPPMQPPEPDLRLLLGPDLFPPKAAAPGKPRRKNAEPRRDYIEDFFPSMPSRHTYVSTPVFIERPSDPREIREKATDEARVAGVTLRKLLANFSKSSSSGAKATDSSKLRDERTMALAVGRGDSRRRARDAAWQAAFDELTSHHKQKKKTAMSSREENGVSPDTLMGDDLMFDERESGRDRANGVAQSEAERRWWMDGIVNAEKEYFSKGTMTRVLKTPIVLV